MSATLWPFDMRRVDFHAKLTHRGLVGHFCVEINSEFLLQRPADLGQARRMVEQSVDIYNCERPHLSLKMQTPDAVHRASLAG